MPKRCAGFSLIELSAVLVIMAVIAGSALSVAVTQKESVKTYETSRKMDRIEEALAGFLALNKRLPCPADGSLTLSDANFGREMKTATSCDTTALTNSGNVAYGMVPVATLQLPSDFALDGVDHRMSYVVDMRFANSSSTIAPAFSNTVAGSITVQASNAADIRTSFGVYLLISHGVNGFGAWPKNGGTRIAGGTDADEEENSHLTTSFNPIFVAKPQTSSFDDEVRFKTKLTALMDAGYDLSEGLCERARNIINGGSGCSGAANSDGCKRLAVEVAMSCL